MREEGWHTCACHPPASRRSGLPDDDAAWIGHVGAVVAAPDGSSEVASERWMVLRDAVERRSDPLGDCETGPLPVGRRPPAAHPLGELLAQDLDLLARLRGPAEIPSRLRFLELVAEPFETAAIGGPRRRIEDL